MVGSAIVRRLQAEGYSRIITRTHAELDLIDQRAVAEFFRGEKIDAVFMAAARVGGIHANNTYRADFIYENLMVECNVIHAAFKSGVERLLFLGSSCIYPRSCPQPMREEYLLSGYLEPTNEPYAVAKIAGIKLCESYNRQHGTHYRSVMPTNLYGPNDSFDLENSHVLPAMLRKFHLAKLAGQGDWEGIRRDEERFGPIPQDVREALPGVRLWGTGVSRREFLHVDDMAAACVFVMQLSDKQYAMRAQAVRSLISTWAAAKTTRSASWRRSSERRWGSRGTSPGTRPGPTACPKSCLTCRVYPDSAGARKLISSME